MTQMFLFSAGDIRGAIPLSLISHVIRMVRLAGKPGDLPWEAGAINFHGRDIPVISLRVLFGEPQVPPLLTDMLVIAQAGDRDVALWVDATSGIQDVLPETLAPDPALPSRPPVPGTMAGTGGIVIIADLSLMIAPRDGVPRQPVAVPGGSPSEVSDILGQRARKIAEPDSSLTDTPMVEVLRFRLAYREYAIEMQYIREVILTGEITPVPGTPDYISGICVVRGEIISLVDLRVLLAIPEKGLTDLNRVIVLTDHSLTFGILADHITGIGNIELERITPVAEETARGGGAYVKGAVGSLVVLDTAAMFRDPAMIIEDS